MLKLFNHITVKAEALQSISNTGMANVEGPNQAIRAQPPMLAKPPLCVLESWQNARKSKIKGSILSCLGVHAGGLPGLYLSKSVHH